MQSAASTLQHPQTGSQFDPNRKHPRNQFQRPAFALGARRHTGQPGVQIGLHAAWPRWLGSGPASGQ